jgi:hypothetical protein
VTSDERKGISTVSSSHTFRFDLKNILLTILQEFF